MASASIFKNFTNLEENKSLLIITKDIQEGKYKKQVEKIRELFNSGEDKKADNLKKQLLAFTPSGTFENGRKAELLSQYSGYIILDLDKLTKEELEKAQEIASNTPYTFASFVSPSGKGLKIIVPVNSKAVHHKIAMQQVASYYQEKLQLPIDPSGKDVCRLCFMSYDPHCYRNIHAQVFEVDINDVFTKPSKKQENTKNSTNETQLQQLPIYSDNVELNFHFSNLIEFTNLKESYHEGNRNNYIYLLASNCNRSGLSKVDAEKLCKAHFNLPVDEIEAAFNSAYKNHKQENNKYNPTSLIPQILNSSNPQNELPTLQDEIFDTIPEFLKKVVKVASSKEERDVLFLTAITTISVALPNIYAIYDEKKVASNLFVFIVAKASAGKGSMVHCRKLINKIHKMYLENSKKAKAQYESDLAQYNLSKSNKDVKVEKPVKPVQKMLFIPANNSATGFFELLNNSDGKGIIFETEGDTLAKSFNSDYGNFSDDFRKIFQHEPISYYRRTDKEYVDIERPQLTAVISGTPKQVPNLIPSAENGLFSRFMFYNMKMKLIWKNVFASKTENGLDDYFEKLGNEFYSLYQALSSSSEIQIILSDEHAVAFNSYFEKIQIYYASIQQEDIISAIRRLALITYRIIMIFTALRIMENGDTSPKIECSKIDFENALKMIQVLVVHSNHQFTQISTENTESVKVNRQELFYKALPYKFNRKIYTDIANSLSIPIKTAEGYIKKLKDNGLIIHESHDNYINPSKKDANSQENIN